MPIFAPQEKHFPRRQTQLTTGMSSQMRNLTIAVHAGMRAVLRHFNHPAAHRQQITGLLVD